MDLEAAGPEGKKGSGFEEIRERARALLHERLEAADYRDRHKEIQEELQRSLGVGAKRFRSFFGVTVSQYVVAYHTGGPEAAMSAASAGKGGCMALLRAGSRALRQQAEGMDLGDGEQEMRAQRAARFQSHLQAERTPVAMVSFNDGEAPVFDGGPIVGELAEMCSREEAKEREMTRQLDKFEWTRGADPRHPQVNLALATKKYQRSSADKAYRSSDVRTLDACWRTMEYLMTQILDSDKNPKPAFAVQSASYVEVYSYLRDRTRSIRVDLHLQQPRSTTQRCFAETHECCLRFEMLSLFLLSGCSGGSTEKYDPKLGLKAISQTVEPLLNAYQALREKALAKSILAEAMGGLLDDGEGEEDYCSPWEMAVRRYIILLLMSFSSEELLTHLAKLSREILSHPLVSFATQVFAAFNTDDYGKFLRLYRGADFLTAVAMSGAADLARLRALWLLLRTYPQAVGDRVPLARIKTFLAFASDAHARSFLAFHGVRVQDDAGAEGGAFVVFPKKGTPEAEKHPLLTGPAKLPEKCNYPKGADSALVAKFEALGLSRADIVFGGADPGVEAEPTPLEVVTVADDVDPLPLPMDELAPMAAAAEDGIGTESAVVALAGPNPEPAAAEAVQAADSEAPPA